MSATARPRPTVAHVVWDGRLSGPPSRVLTLAPHLAELGWDSVLVLPEEGSAWLQEHTALPCPTVPLPLGRMYGRPHPLLQMRWLAGLAGDRRRLREALRTHGASVVHSYGLANQQALRVARAEALPVVWHLNDLLTPRWFRRLMGGRLRSWPDALLVDGPDVARAHGLDPSELSAVGSGAGGVVVPCYDETRFHRDVSPRPELRAERDLPDDAVVVVTVGNLNPAKGYPHLIQGFLEARALDPRLHLLVVGAVLESQAALHESLVAAVAAADATGAVHFLGPRLDVPEILATADLYVQASVSETGPAAVAEAAAVGLPVVATDVGLVREMVRPGETGAVVPPGDPEALARALLEIARHPRRAALGRAGADHVAQRFSARASARRLAEVYRRVTGSEPSGG